MPTQQYHLQLPSSVPDSAYDYGKRSSGDTHGVVLTKPHVVELILDLAGYTTDRELHQLRLLEPSCGHGAFLVAALRRLLVAARRAGVDPSDLTGCLVGIDIDQAHVDLTRAALLNELRSAGVAEQVAEALTRSWVRRDDFLLAPLQAGWDVVVGNPPYVRIEQIAEALQVEYRRRFAAIYDRADLYVAFIERGLSLLGDHGTLSFVCADRWTVNKYGAPLRRLVAEQYSVRAYVDLHNASPFEADVIAYPSIFALQRGQPGTVPVVTLTSASEEECASVTRAIANGESSLSGVQVARYAEWFRGDEPWVLGSPEHLALLRSLEARFAPIEESAKVGIGVATGCDHLYVVSPDEDIEADRLVPLVMRDDIHDGKIVRPEHAVINTFDEAGRVVDLDKYPRLKRYLEQRGTEIRKRHVARKNPRAWFRTIDRVYPALAARPKLLIPDIAGANEVVLEEGRYHPHHNLYYVVSDQWDLEVLGGLLSSKIALFFVWSYAVKMRGGYLRFQAQYLRRIRLPAPSALSSKLAREIKKAFRARDFVKIDRLALEAYGLERLPDFDFVDTRR